MVLYSDKRPARFWRKARSIALLKVSCKTPGVGLASGTLPNTGFCAEVRTCDVGSCAAPLLEVVFELELELEVEVEVCAPNAAGKMTIETIRKTFSKRNV